MINNKWVRVTLLLTMVFMLFLQLYAVIKYGNYFLLGDIERMDNDDVKFIRSAWVFLDKGIFTYRYPDVPTVYIMPGLTYILAGFMKIFGRGYGGLLAFRIFQAVLQILSLYIIFIITRDIFGEMCAALACILDSVYLPETFSTGLILTEVIFKFLLLLLVSITIKAVKKKDMRYYIIGGIIWGAACLVRPTIALYPAAVLVLWLINGYSLKESAVFTSAVLIVFCLIMSPWWVRNYITFKRFIPLTLSSGNPFLQGTYINYDQSRNYTPYRIYNDEIKDNEMETMAAKLRLATYFKKEPAAYIYWYTIGKSKYLWLNPFYWKPLFNIPAAAVKLYHLILLIFAAYGIYRAFKTKPADSSVLILIIAYITLVYLPFYAFGRYFYPAMPFIIILSAFGMLNAVKRLLKLNIYY